MEKTVFVAVMKQNDDPRTVKEYLDELQFLAETAGAIGEKRFIQKMEKPNSRTYIGSGKLAEIKAYIEENGTDLVIFDDELTPSQLRNIERELQCRILDRTNLILDIFAQRAKPLTPRHRSNSPNTSTCFRALQGCGPTLKGKEEVSE